MVFREIYLCKISNKHTPKRCFQTKKSLKIQKKNYLLTASGLSHPHYHCTVHKQICRGKQSTMVPGSFWVKLAQGVHLCNVGPWQTDNFYDENNLYNVVSTMLGQHCIEILSSHFCPRTSETTLHQIITFAMLVQSVQTCFRRKTTYTMLP